MNCYDCLVLGRTTVAAAVCNSCGAGLCMEHTSDEYRLVHRLVAMGKATHDRKARVLLCQTCSEAEREP